MANTSAIWQQTAHTTYQLSSPSCSTRAIQEEEEEGGGGGRGGGGKIVNLPADLSSSGRRLARRRWPGCSLPSEPCARCWLPPPAQWGNPAGAFWTRPRTASAASCRTWRPAVTYTEISHAWQNCQQQQQQQRLIGLLVLYQSSGAVWKSRWPSWALVPNKPTVNQSTSSLILISRQPHRVTSGRITHSKLFWLKKNHFI